ncbi:nuclear apoptosis-inducing factor 1-like [Crassostrea virginica]
MDRMKMNFVAKKRKPNWSERELTVLAEATTPRMKFLKAKFSPSLTSERKQEFWKEIADEVNSTTLVSRTVDEIKKKWADIQSLTKKKEGERRRSMSKTGGGPAPEFYFKEWEKVVLQSLSDIAIEGIACGVDTAECGLSYTEIVSFIRPGSGVSALGQGSTLALEQINDNLKHGNSQHQSYSLSPVIKLS